MDTVEVKRRVDAWQDAGFVHPLTCYNSKHGNMVAEIINNKVILKCPKCKWVQEKIPPSILTITPEELAEEKQRLIEIGFKFDNTQNPQQ